MRLSDGISSPNGARCGAAMLFPRFERCVCSGGCLGVNSYGKVEPRGASIGIGVVFC